MNLNMNKTHLGLSLAIILLVIILALTSKNDRVSGSTAPWITGYYESGYGTALIPKIPWTKYTHMINAGAQTYYNGNQWSLDLGAQVIDQTSDTFVSTAHAKGVKALLLVGGPGGNFSSATAPGNISAYVTNIVNTVNNYGYDGVDIDWENNVVNTQYADLISRLASALHPSGKLVTTALGFWDNLPAAGNLAKDNLDQINAMCYDMDFGAQGSWFVDALYADANGNGGTDVCTSKLVNAGIPKSKIGVGIPFYGRNWTNATAPLQSGAVMGGEMYYSSLVTDSVLWQTANQKWDTAHHASYLSIPTLNRFIPYTGVRDIQEIVAWALPQGYGGFMSWAFNKEYMANQTGDASYPLSTALFQAVNGIVTPPPPPSSPNLASGLSATTNGAFSFNYPASGITDGDLDSSHYTGTGGGVPQWIKLDLGQTYSLNKIKVWHYFADSRIYHDVIIQVSNDPNFLVGVTTVFNNDANNSLGQGIGSNSEYVESSAGKDITFSAGNARYIRLWTNGNTVSDGNEYVEVEAYGNTVSADTQPPLVSITSPSSGLAVGTVNVTANASDNVGVAGVQFKLDGANLSAEDTVAPYSTSWNTLLTPDGTHALVAVARDTAGNQTTSSNISVSIDVGAPSVPTNLSATAVSSSQINLAWNASIDTVGVVGYKVFRGGVQIATAATNSYSNTGLSAGTYTYTVQAYDAAGNTSSQSAPASATLQSTPPPPTRQNISAGLIPITNGSFINLSGSVITDGDKTSAKYSATGGGSAQWIKFDLGQTYALDDIKVWHYFADGRTYHDVIVQLSNDSNFATGVTTVFNNDLDGSSLQGNGGQAEYVETSAGKDVPFATTNARYIRLWTNGNTVSDGNEYVEVEAYGATSSQALPIISSVTAINISTNSAIISWTTDILSNSRVEYGKNSSSLNFNVSNTNLTKNHLVFLSGLSKKTTYYYRALSSDNNGGASAVSPVQSFRTLTRLAGANNIFLAAIHAVTDTVHDLLAAVWNVFTP
jgi:GH18 family chitinase